MLRWLGTSLIPSLVLLLAAIHPVFSHAEGNSSVDLSPPPGSVSPGTLRQGWKEAEEVMRALRVNGTALRGPSLKKPDFASSRFRRAEREAREALSAAGKRFGFRELAENATGTPPRREGSGEERFPPVSRRLMVVVSSSLPQELLRNWALQALRLRKKKGWHFTFVLRGFVQGMDYLSPTLRWVLSWDLYGERPEPGARLIAPVNVDPNAVRRYGVESPPAVIDLNRPDCVVYGDQTLEFMVRKIDENQCGEVFGRTYAFAEEDALSEIARRAEEWMDRNRGRVLARLRERVRERLERLACDVTILTSEKDFEYMAEGNYTLPFDVPDPRRRGAVLYPKGFTYNPLEYVTVPGSFLFFDASDPREVVMLPAIISRAPAPVRVLVLGGDYVDLLHGIARRFSDRAVIFPGCDALKRFMKLYGVKPYAPSLVVQEGRRWRVRVFGVGRDFAKVGQETNGKGGTP